MMNWAGSNESSLENDSWGPSSAPLSSSLSSYYDLVMHMRPDLAYERVDVAEMRAIAQRAPGDRVFVGDFDHTWSGVNDRIALGYDSSF